MWGAPRCCWSVAEARFLPPGTVTYSRRPLPTPACCRRRWDRGNRPLCCRFKAVTRCPQSRDKGEIYTAAFLFSNRVSGAIWAWLSSLNLHVCRRYSPLNNTWKLTGRPARQVDCSRSSLVWLWLETVFLVHKLKHRHFMLNVSWWSQSWCVSSATFAPVHSLLRHLRTF